VAVRQISLILLLSVALAAGGRRPPVCTVGALSFNKRDLVCRAAVAEVYYPGRGLPYVALAQLVEGGLAVEVLRNLGHRLTPAMLEAEATRIDEHTRDPERLARIKAVYGKERSRYLKGFVAAVCAQRILTQVVFPASRPQKGRGTTDTQGRGYGPPNLHGYSKWFWAHAQTVPVAICDPDLLAELVAKVSWAHRLHLHEVATR